MINAFSTLHFAIIDVKMQKIQIFEEKWGKKNQTLKEQGKKSTFRACASRAKNQHR